MKTLTLVLVVATTGLAVASVQFYRQIGVEKARAEAEVALRQKQDARIRELEKAQANLEQELAMAQSLRAGPPQEVATAAAPPLGPSVASRLERNLPPGATFATLPRPMRGPMDSDAGRRFMRTQMRGNIRRLYQDVGRDLNLTQDQADKLMDLMADQRTRMFADRRQPPADRAAAAQMFKEQQEENTKQVAAIIGDSKMAEWNAYQQTIPQRSQVESVNQQLENAGMPMSADQRSQLVAAMVDEARNNPRPTLTAGLAPEEAAKQMNDWQDAYDKSVNEHAKQVLSSEQYDRYHDYTEWMAEMRKNAPQLPGGGRAFRFSNGAAGTTTFQLAVPMEGAAVAAPPPRQ